MPIERVQKITEALYRVTEFFSDKEPLKWRLRSDAVEIFDFLLSSENKKEIFGVENILNLIRGIESALQLASSFGGYIPGINFEILRREYLSLAESLQIQFENRKQELYSSAVENLLPVSPPSDELDSIGQIKNSNGQPFIDNGHNGQEESASSADSPERREELKKEENKDNNNGHPILLGERKRKILGLISAKGGSASGGKDNNTNNANNSDKWLTIREISSSLPELGAKSVQRDLLEMVGAGILKKTGDKRWRKYSLV